MTSDLIVNPHSTLRIERDASGVTGVVVTAPVRGKPLTPVVFLRAAEPVLADLLLGFLSESPDLDPELGDAETKRLVDAGFFVEEDDAPRAPSFRLALLPGVRGAAWPDAHAEAVIADEIVHPGLRIAPDDTLPAQFAPGPVLLVPDLGRRTDTPYWGDEATLRSLEAGKAAPGGMAPGLTNALREAGVLVTRSRIAEEEASFARLAVERGAELARDDYTVVPCLLPAAHVDALTSYFRELIAEGFLMFKDPQSTRYVRHEDPVARHVHEQLASLVGAIAGTRVRPSYSYFAAYEPGAELPRHTDRPQCEYSFSLQLGYLPDPSLSRDWPIYLETPRSGEVPVRLSPGEALLYRGRKLPHYRHPLPGGHRSMHIFFHFVDWDFAGSLT